MDLDRTGIWIGRVSSDLDTPRSRGEAPVSGSRLSSYRPGTKDSRGRILKRHFRGDVPRPQHAPVYFGTSSSRAARYRGISSRAQTLEAKLGVLRPRNVPFEGDPGGLGRRSFAFSCSCLVDSALRGPRPESGRASEDTLRFLFRTPIRTRTRSMPPRGTGEPCGLGTFPRKEADLLVRQRSFC
jgi:hypothetical protein